MLKKRLIACLVVKGGIVVQSIGFRRFLPVGRVDIAVAYLNQWGIDEIVILDIDATREGRGPDVAMIERAARKGFVPLTVGGGIRDVATIKQALLAGADKIALNHAALATPSLIQEGAAVFGQQCMVVSLDVKRHAEGTYEVYADGGRRPTGRDPLAVAQEAEAHGAGELFLTAIDQDGRQQGYDLDLIRRVAPAVHIPVIVCGGVGHPHHLLEGLQADGVSAVAAANFFHYTEHSVTVAKSYLRNAGIPLRLDTYADYGGRAFDPRGRLEKRPEETLEELYFTPIPKEVI